MSGAAYVRGQSLGGLVLRLDDDLDVLRNLHPLTLRRTAAFTAAVAITKTTRAATATLVTIPTRTGARRAVTTRAEVAALTLSLSLSLSLSLAMTATTAGRTGTVSTIAFTTRRTVTTACRRPAAIPTVSAHAATTRPAVFTLFIAAEVRAAGCTAET
jgi:hypothetical protein